MNKYILIVVAAAALSGCGSKEIKDKAASASDATATNNLTQSIDTFTDSRDGKTYKTVKIGTAVWMAENLNFAAEGSKCYENSEDSCAKYGRLYNWETALKACPAGFHLPSDDEWTALENAVGGRSTAGTKLKSAAGWNEDGNGTDHYGWSALPSGRRGSDGVFSDAGNSGGWWGATESDANFARGRYMYYLDEDVGLNDYDKTDLMSVRCVADK